MAGHTLLGYVLAVGVQGAVRGEHWAAALRALVIWVLFLNGGTLAINSVFDRDEGDIGYLNAPPPLPRYLLHFSLGLLIAGPLLAFGLLTWATVILGVGSKGLALALPMVLWLAVLVPWLIGYASWTPAQHQRGMYRALAAWAVTDLTVLFVFAS